MIFLSSPTLLIEHICVGTASTNAYLSLFFKVFLSIGALRQKKCVQQLNISDIQKCVIFGKDGHHKMMEIRLMTFWKSEIWEQDLSNNMEWTLGKS